MLNFALLRPIEMRHAGWMSKALAVTWASDHLRPSELVPGLQTASDLRWYAASDHLRQSDCLRRADRLRPL